jgi:hypothetical protein
MPNTIYSRLYRGFMQGEGIFCSTELTGKIKFSRPMLETGRKLKA